MSAIVCELHVPSNCDGTAFIVCGVATFDDGISDLFHSVDRILRVFNVLPNLEC
jgi:hypothetical protein